MSGSPYDRAQGKGFSANSIYTITSNAGGQFADGYVIEKRGTLRYLIISMSGMPVAGAPPILVVRDGPAGVIYGKYPLYGIETKVIPIPFGAEALNGVYVSGISAMVGAGDLELTVVHETETFNEHVQDEPR